MTEIEKNFWFPRCLAMPMVQVGPCERLLATYNSKHGTQHTTIDRMLLEMDDLDIPDCGGLSDVYAAITQYINGMAADIRDKSKDELERRWFSDEEERAKMHARSFPHGEYKSIGATA